ncbi:MAG: sensor domain-containing diguanylate cyclase [Burkholderiales bacterium]|nr:sensor domain-containing diguanylate cyclase [Burkholderiales bacterium]
METSNLSDHEAERVAALYQSGTLDGLEADHFDFIVRAAGKLCNVPQAFVAFIDRETVWIKASLDYLPFLQLPRDSTYGDLALEGDQPFVVSDLAADPRTASHPLTRSGHGFRMYAATAIRTPDGNPIGVLSLLDQRPRDLTAEELEWLSQLGQQASAIVEWCRQRRQLESALIDHERATRLDALTGLPNRPWLMAKIDEECVRALRFGQPLALIVFDLDKMGNLNRQLGREAGDAMLARVGRMLRQALRNTDTAGRMAGDRFCVVLPNTTAEGAATLAETLRGRIERKSDPLEPALAMTASFGVAATDQGHRGESGGLVAATLTALEQARQDGRNRVAIAAPPLPRQH